MAANWAGYTWEDFDRLPGSMQWSDGYGDDKSSTLVAYRIAKMQEALTYEQYDTKK